MGNLVHHTTEAFSASAFASQAYIKTRTFFSDAQEEVAVTNAVGDKSLPSVALPAINGTIVAVYAGFKFRMVENTSGSANKLSGVTYIQIRTASPVGNWSNAIGFVDDQFSIAASTREGGDTLVGNIDLSPYITKFSQTIDFQWDNVLADQSNLQFNDCYTFLIVQYLPT